MGFWVAISFGSLFLVGLIFFFYHSENHNAYLWRRQKSRVWDELESLGFEIDRSADRATGKLHGLTLHLGFRSVRHSKSQLMSVWANLHIGDTAEGLEITNEGVLSGVFRIFGSEELNLDDPEFDAAFWIEGKNLEEVRDYLTPRRRRGLLLGFSELAGAKLKENRILSAKSFSTPLRIRSHSADILEQFRVLARAFGETDSEAETLGPTGVVARKVRQFARFSLVVFTVGFLASLPVDGAEGTIFTASMIIGAICSVVAFLPGEIGRTLLQSYFAFLTLMVFALVSAILGGYFGELQELGEYATVLVFGSVGALYFWGSRHYLKSMDQTGIKKPLKKSEVTGL